MKKIILYFFVVIAILFQGCATKEAPKKEEERVVYPAPPNEPRVAYIDTYRGRKDSEAPKLSAMDILMGETIESKAMNPVIIKPYGVSLNNGKIYAVDTAAKFVYQIDEKTRDVLLIGMSGPGTLAGPVDVAVDGNGSIYISDMRLKKIHVYNDKGIFQSSFGSRLELTHPTGIIIDKKLNRLYVADTKAHKIKVYDLQTKKILFELGKRGHENGEFNFPTNIAIDKRNNNIVVADTQNFRVQIFDKDGKFIRTFGKVGDRPGEFARPKGIGVDTEGHIYVTDSAFNNVQIFNEEGKLMMFFGHAGYVEPGTFRLITGLYIDEKDKIVIADGFTGRVQTFQYISENWKKDHPKEYQELKEIKPKVDPEKESNLDKKVDNK